MSRDAWDEFSKTILVRYVLSYLCGTLYLDPSASLKRIFAFSVGGLFSLSTHALTCLSRKMHFTLLTGYKFFNTRFSFESPGHRRIDNFVFRILWKTIDIFLISEPQVSAEKTLGETEAAVLQNNGGYSWLHSQKGTAKLFTSTLL